MVVKSWSENLKDTASSVRMVDHVVTEAALYLHTGCNSIGAHCLHAFSDAEMDTTIGRRQRSNVLSPGDDRMSNPIFEPRTCWAKAAASALPKRPDETVEAKGLFCAGFSN